MLDSTKRFSSRVADYVKYRPGYPEAVLELLSAQCGLHAGSAVADIGSGPGNLTRLFLDFGCTCIGVEPNKEMREAGEEQLGGNARFTSVDGTAEATGLASGSVDFVTAGQAFHWFDPPATRKEFVRILRPGGWVALIWNDRNLEADAFSAGYEEVLSRLATGYGAVKNLDTDRAIFDVFFGAELREASFPSFQAFDWEGFLGRVMSSSYVPQGGPEHAAIVRAMRELFDRESVGGQVKFTYDTKVFYGQLG